MINKLPPWVEIGGFLLTLIAGSINVIGILGFEHQASSHLTGVSSFIGYEVAHGNWINVLHLNGIVFSFVLGAALGGLLVRDGQLLLGRRYGITLFIEALLLLLALWTLNLGSKSGHFFTSAACGLQNAMTTTYSGAIVRTTHVSGLFTDLGIMLGNWLRGLTISYRKVLLYLVLTNGFIVGGIIGSWSYSLWKTNALAVPMCITFALAIVYEIFLRRQNIRKP